MTDTRIDSYEYKTVRGRYQVIKHQRNGWEVFQVLGLRGRTYSMRRPRQEGKGFFSKTRKSFLV